jgi:hypothetical protein
MKLFLTYFLICLTAADISFAVLESLAERAERNADKAWFTTNAGWNVYHDKTAGSYWVPQNNRREFSSGLLHFTEETASCYSDIDKLICGELGKPKEFR